MTTTEAAADSRQEVQGPPIHEEEHELSTKLKMPFGPAVPNIARVVDGVDFAALCNGLASRFSRKGNIN
jgi:hypothetical protein